MISADTRPDVIQPVHARKANLLHLAQAVAANEGGKLLTPVLDGYAALPGDAS